MGCRERVDGGLQEVLASVAVEVGVSLGEGDELGSVVEGVQDEGAVLFGEAEVLGDLRGDGGAVCLLFEELGVDGSGLRIVRIGGSSLGMLLLPPVGGVEVDQGYGDLFFFSAALCADVADQIAIDAIAHDDLVAAVFEDEAGAVGCGGIRLECGGVLGGGVSCG